MNCRCGKKAEIDLSYESDGVCRHCFLKRMERRVRKEIRDKDVGSWKKICLYDLGGASVGLAEHFLKKIFHERIPVERVSSPNGSCTLTPVSADRVGSFLLESFLRDEVCKNIVQGFLTSVSEEEIRIANDLLGLEKREVFHISEFQREMEKSLPGTAFGLRKSWEFLER
ncbi:hypothetical protein CMO92_01060 [Candidatus Woesearchaeota archaeon]|nr:hypothetical protein [Candidatus Woesearchaeota archaeon]|tara:strand:+ start:883 stop:1392 length:510 start_codon:yes stop_codon:yes gene_type:complete